MQERFRLLFRNPPFRPLAWLLRAPVYFPVAHHTATRDRIDHDAAAILSRALRPSHHRASSLRRQFAAPGRDRTGIRAGRQVAPIEKTLRDDARRAGLLRGKSSGRMGE